MTAQLAVLEALAVTAELTQTQLSAPAAKVMAEDLSIYPPDQVLGALTRCRKELRGRLTVSDVVQRLDDGRPGAEEAWAMLPFDEAATIVWTEEMAGAWGVALPLLEDGDRIAARMAFLESYRTRVQRARDSGIAVKWNVSLGHKLEDRVAAIQEAHRLGRIGTEYVARLLPAPGVHPSVPLPRLK